MHRLTPTPGPTGEQSNRPRSLDSVGSRYRTTGAIQTPAGGLFPGRFRPEIRHPAIRPGIRAVFAPKGANNESERGSRMHPTPDPASGPTGAKITKLPPAGREEMLAQEGLDGSAHWSEVRHWGHGPDDVVAVSGDLAWDDPDAAIRELEERGFLLDGGWHAVEPGKGRGEGMTSHRGALRGDEFIDHELLVALVERRLGFTFDDVHAVYRKGRLTTTQRELRGQIDARLLALSRSGSNMTLLGRVLGFKVTPDGHCRAVQHAIARAREAEALARYERAIS